MDSKNNELRLLNSNDEVLCSVWCVTYYDEENEYDEGDTYFCHVITGLPCERFNQIFHGYCWDDNEKMRKLYKKLGECIEDDCELKLKIFDLDEIDYYI